MNKLFTILLVTLSGETLHAQTFAEWFKQDKTQRKYLLEQIAALKVYAGYVEKGYAIAQTGLTALNNIKKGDFSLHSDYFKSLKIINPELRNDARVAGIMTLDAQIKKVANDVVKQAKKSVQIAVSEKAYIEKVSDNLVQGCKADVTLLTQIMSPDQLELTDDQRWKRIGALYEEMSEEYAFAQSFAASVQLLIARRSREANDIENEKSILGIK